MYYYYIPPTYHQQYTYVPWAVDMEERAGLRKWYRVYMKNPVYSSQLVGCRLKKIVGGTVWAQKMVQILHEKSRIFFPIGGMIYELKLSGERFRSLQQVHPSLPNCARILLNSK
jgi:hypothetical protein